jgi:hypothetical protein
LICTFGGFINKKGFFLGGGGILLIKTLNFRAFLFGICSEVFTYVILKIFQEGVEIILIFLHGLLPDYGTRIKEKVTKKTMLFSVVRMDSTAPARLYRQSLYLTHRLKKDLESVIRDIDIIVAVLGDEGGNGDNLTTARKHVVFFFIFVLRPCSFSG